MPRKIGELTLYSVDDLHEMLGVSKLTLRTYIRNGKIKGRKLGVSWYVTEDAIRNYFEEPQESESTAPSGKKEAPKYIVQGVNDLVSETEECETVDEVLTLLNEQPIISLFQVQIVDRATNEIKEIIKARDFIEQHANR
ncbi:MAG: helix-turn-helix domain-containing protein [Balneolaceae bacterium]|nr:helix-turn-helix domain-containing protein [Balneolaceae bacterium]